MKPTHEVAADAAKHLVAYLTCVDTSQLEPSFAGRRYDAQLLHDRPQEVDPCGERGEFHTCVVAAPSFSQPIMVVGEQLLRDNRFQYGDFRLAD